MELFYKGYKVEIYDDEMYSTNSADNKITYDYELFDTSEKECYYMSKCGIRILKDENVIKSVVLLGSGSPTRIGKNSYILLENMLYVAVGSAVYGVNLPDLTLNWVTQADDSCCFGIYSFIDSFVVHGELSITCIEKTGNIKWQYCGADIFVTPEGTNDFEILNDKVRVKDWNGNIYLLNSDGQNEN